MISGERGYDLGTEKVMAPKVDGRFRAFFWPTLQNAEDAKKAAKAGAGAALFCAVVTGAVTTLALAGITIIPNVNAWNYIDAAIFLVLAYFISRLSRASAIITLALYLIERFYMVLQLHEHAVGPIAILFILIFINAIRGTFAYRRFTVSSVPHGPGLLHAHA